MFPSSRALSHKPPSHPRQSKDDCCARDGSEARGPSCASRVLIKAWGFGVNLLAGISCCPGRMRDESQL